MSLRIFNTMTHLKEDFEPLEPGVVKMYVCGPTVYDKAHIGHAMSAVVFDMIRRYLEHRGYQVVHVMNYTDVDDKIIERANRIGVDPVELAEKHIRDFNQHINDLNILPATANPRATQEMDRIIDLVQGLVGKGLAYAVEGNVYFRVEKDEEYGKLSGRKLEDMQAGARLQVDQLKEHPMDFALWKSAKTGEPYWESPWGDGRPGWHIECSAMSLAHLGEQIDIHGGGNDLIFPHHENEIAQTESLTHKPFAKYWVHNGMLQFSGDKMSKSLGNIFSIEEFLNQHSGDVFRMMILNSNYRKPLIFNDKVVAQSEKALERLKSVFRHGAEGQSRIPSETLSILKAQVEGTREGFQRSMDDDFNSAGALGYIFDLVRSINTARDSGANSDDLRDAQDLLTKLARVLGLRLDIKVPLSPASIIANGQPIAVPFINLLVEIRTVLRQEKMWELSDQIRDKLAEQGIIIEDTKGETTWREV